jgi:hypothetical protein
VLIRLDNLSPTICQKIGHSCTKGSGTDNCRPIENGMELLRNNLGAYKQHEQTHKESSAPQFSVIVTESPPVSPSVVAAILMIQKTIVTSGT